MPRALLAPVLLLLALLTFAAPARADDISAAGRSVVRVVVVAVEDGEVVGFGHGSGFAVAPNRIVTNAHVVALAVQYPKDVVIGIVPSEGNRSYGARIVRVDAQHDLALLEMEQGRLPPIPLFLGALPDGATVAALGYPGNVDLATAQSADDYITPLPPTRSMGNYSNERRINGIAALLHTANIARGNSGGPLLDQCGRVIGVNTFITRGDEGDSPFGFAIAIREVAAFLRAAGQAFSAVSSECVSMEERLAQDRQRSEAEARERAAAGQARERERQQRIEHARARIQEIRENRVALALLLVVLAAAALGGALVMLHKDRHRHAYILGGIGVLFILVAAASFVTRPSLADVEALGTAAEAAPDAAGSFAGRHSCRLVADRSRITVSSAPSVDLEWAEGGCVNGRTQYAQDGENWRRILVPNGEQAVSVIEIHPGARQYVVTRYLLAADAMARARALRGRIDLAQCTAEQPRIAALAEGQEQIRRILPQLPNERLVYDCSG
ncbi:MAG TPA: trypsin-like peptidase domain-containing protein [Allosphingosinicella sp.]|jgi:V8-like Glu-specific endopeptidase